MKLPAQTYGIAWKNAATVFPDSACRPGKRMTKLEVAGEDPYQVVSMYVEIDGKPCCLRMATRIDGEFMPDGYSRMRSCHL